MKVSQILGVFGAASVALSSVSAFPVSAANAVIEYTLTPAETAAYYGLTVPHGDISNSGMKMYVWYYTDDTQTETRTFNTSRSVLDYTVTDLDGYQWIVVQYNYQTAAFVDRRSNLQYTIWAQPALEFDDLYSITKGYGFVGASTLVQNPQSNYVNFRWFLGNSSDTSSQLSGSANVAFPLNDSGQYLTERWSRTDTSSLVVTNSITYSISSILPEVQLRKSYYDSVYYCAPASTIIEDASGSSYSRMLIRCPTIRYAQSDEEAIKESLQSILGGLTLSPEDSESVSSAVADADQMQQSVTSLLQDEHDFLESQRFTGFPDGYEPTFTDDSVGFLALIYRFWENNPYFVTVSSACMALAFVSYILYGRKV